MVHSLLQNQNVWNMDEKGFLMGDIGKERVITSKHERKIYMTRPGNQEWVSLMKCVSMNGKVLSPWIIFKGKLQMKAWWDVLKTGHIALSENGWTDNGLGLAWLQQAFDPESNDRRIHLTTVRTQQPSKYPIS